jgi:hypothetical protein
MFALNTSRHESTRYTLLNFSRELVVPNAVHRPTPEMPPPIRPPTPPPIHPPTPPPIHPPTPPPIHPPTPPPIRLPMRSTKLPAPFTTPRGFVHRHERPLSSGVQPPIPFRTEDPQSSHQSPKTLPNDRTPD